jgi:hypothetical protein
MLESDRVPLTAFKSHEPLMASAAIRKRDRRTSRSEALERKLPLAHGWACPFRALCGFFLV